MEIQNFLKDAKIPNFYMWYFLSDGYGRKTPIGAMNNADMTYITNQNREQEKRERMGFLHNKPSYYNKNKQIIYLKSDERDTLKECFSVFINFIIEDNYKLSVIDVDENSIHSLDEFIDKTGYDFLKDCPWCEGNTKGIHIYCFTENVPQHSDHVKVFNKFDGDFFHNKIVWERVDKKIHNFNGSFPKFNYFDIQHIFNEKIQPQEESESETEGETDTETKEYISKGNEGEIEKHILLGLKYNIFSKFKDAYTIWRNIGFLIKNEMGDDGLDLWIKVCEVFEPEKYDKDDATNFYNGLNRTLKNENKKPLTIKSLCKYYKDIDPVIAKKIFAEFRKKEHEVNDDESYNDVTEANHVFTMYPYWKCCQKVLYCFDETTGMWSDDENLHRSVIRKFARGKYNKFVNYMNNVRTYIKSLCVDNDFIEKNANTSLKKLLFKNGYYDGDTGIFHTTFNSNILFFARINHDFKRCSKKSLDELRKKFFYDPLNEEVGNYYLQILSRAMMGDKMKKIIFGLGKTDCGKSTITAAITKSFGGYVGTFNANNLINKPINDMAQSLRWSLILRFCRVIFSNEMDEDRDLNCALIKAISGETDNIVARGHCKDETSFLPHFLPICFANGMSNISPYDPAMDGRVEVFDYKKQFVKSNPIENQLLQDPNLKYEMETEEFQQTFTSLFIEEYEKYKKPNGELPRPSLCINAKQKWVSQSNHIDNIATFLEEFEFTDKQEDKIFSKEIHNFISELESKVTPKKFVVELKEYIEKQGYKNVISKTMSIGGIKGQGWTGIKRL